jgi:O-antigen ligase
MQTLSISTLDAPAVRQAAPVAASSSGSLKWKWDPMRLGLFVLTMVVVSRFHQHWRFIGVLRPALLMVGLLGFYALANPKAVNADNLLKYWPSKLILGICALAFFSMPFGISMGNSGFFILDSFSKTIVYALLLIVSVRTARELYFHFWTYTLGVGVLCYLSLFVFGLTKHQGGVERLSNLYTYDANDAGLVVLTGIPMMLLIFQLARPLGKIVAMTVLVMACATIARTGSRGAFVGLMGLGIGLLFLVRSVSPVKRGLFLGLASVALVIWAPEGYWKQMKTIFSPTEDYNYNLREGRKEVAKRGLGYMMSYPVFGLGINNFQKAECFLADKAKNYTGATALRCTPPHNTYVQAGAELGVGGLVAMALLIWGGVVSMVKLSRRLPREWARGSLEQRFALLAPQYLAVSAVGFGLSCFFLSFAWMDVTYFLAAMFVGTYAVTDNALKEHGGQPAAAPVAVAPPSYPPPVVRQPLLAPSRR